MSFQNQSAFVSPDFIIRAATLAWEQAGAEALRHQVFVREQGIFQTHDRDTIDEIATPLVAISTYASEADQVVGTVRIHKEAEGLWRGSRLAVAPSHRRIGSLGTELIRLAVSTANGRGCDRFLAHVQIQNVPLFKRLHWTPIQEVDLHGVPHMEMSADLDFYPPIADPACGWKTLGRRRRRRT